jgi:hypothetical protein
MLPSVSNRHLGGMKKAKLSSRDGGAAFFCSRFDAKYTPTPNTQSLGVGVY